MTYQYVIVWVRNGQDNVFWSNGVWIKDPEGAEEHYYSTAMKVIWRELEPPIEGRYTAVPKFVFTDPDPSA